MSEPLSLVGQRRRWLAAAAATLAAITLAPALWLRVNTSPPASRDWPTHALAAVPPDSKLLILRPGDGTTTEVDLHCREQPSDGKDEPPFAHRLVAP